jgi:predicted lipoprotein with Yx(FWY)xxD motif
MRGLKLFAIASVLLLGMAACSDDEPSSGDGGSSPSPAAEAPTGTEVATGDSALGTILMDADGNTLYLFEPDAEGESTCYEDCADNWPALATDGDPVASSGVDAALLGTTERTDGTVQVTYAGWPLYYFAGDEAPGDTNGQEVGDVWYVVSPAGEAIESEGEAEGEGEGQGGDEASEGSEVESEGSPLGTILTDSDGNTLYVFFADADGESTCYDECADNWPAFVTEGDPAAGRRIDASLLGTTERTDGSIQVTYAGWPLYYFAGDEQPGDTNGQDVGDVWYVIAPDGEPIEG